VKIVVWKTTGERDQQTKSPLFIYEYEFVPHFEITIMYFHSIVCSVGLRCHQNVPRHVMPTHAIDNTRIRYQPQVGTALAPPSIYSVD
jgi:hypothetical protein